MKIPGLLLSRVLLVTILVGKTSTRTLPQLKGIDHWFDDDQEGGSGGLVDQVEVPRGSRGSRDCNPDWMETIRNDIRRLSDRVDLRERGESLADRSQSCKMSNTFKKRNQL